MKKIIITILGRGNYQLAKYQVENNDPIESKLVGGVLKEIIQPNEIYVIGTNESLWHIADEYIKDYKKVLIPFGMNSQEFWDMFDTIAKLPVENSEIYFDMTHGFRSIPIFISTLLNFFTKVKKAQIKGVYYGVWEATSKNNGITPVVNILPLLEMNEVIEAFTIFKEYSDGRKVANILYKQFQTIPNNEKKYFKKIQELNRKLEFYSKTVGFSALKFYHQTLNEIKELIQQIESNNRIHQYFKTVSYVIDDLKEELQIYDGFTITWQKYLKTAKVFYDKNRYTQTLVILRETVLTYILENLQLDIFDENLRETKLGRILFEEQNRLINKKDTLYFNKEFLQIYQQIKDLRNKACHAFMKKEVSEKSIDTSVKNLNKYISTIENIFNSQSVIKNQKKLKDILVKKLFLLFSHKLTSIQENDAKKNLGIEKFVYLPDNLQNLWSNIPPTLKNLNDYLEPIKEFLRQNAQKGDIVLIQGDFGGCFEMVNFVKSLNLKAVHSTTKRDVIEKTVNGKVEKFSVFEHVIFREY